MADVTAHIISQIQSFLTQSWPSYLLSNLKLFAYIIAILLVGFVFGKILKKITVRVINRTGLGRVSSNKTWTDMLRAAGYRGNVVQLIGDLVKWIVYIMALSAAIQLVGLPGIANVFTSIATFVPRFIMAIVIFVVGLIAADFFGRMFSDAGSKFFGEEAVGRFSGGVAKYFVVFVVAIMALAVMGLDTTALLLTLGFMLASLLAVLVFGLKDLLPNLTAGMHLRSALPPGTKVTVGKYSGTVEKVDALSTRINSGSETIMLPNLMLLNSPVKKGRRANK